MRLPAVFLGEGIKSIYAWITTTALLLFLTDVSCGLRCYDCLYNPPGNGDVICVENVTSARERDCNQDQRYCQVELVKIDHDIQKFHRSCEANCDSGCDGAEGYYKCVSCCQDDLCNTGNGAVPLNESRSIGVVICFIVACILLPVSI